MSIDIIALEELLRGSVRMATPIILATTGGIYCERSGIFPVGMEGWMLVGAFTSVAISRSTGNLILASLAGMLAGMLLSLIFAFLTINRKVDQMVIGLGSNIFALGLTNWLAPSIMKGEMTRVALFPVLSTPQMQKVPIIGQMILSQPVIVWIALILPIFSAIVLYRTKFGLNIRSVGENPQAVAAAGLSVFKYRYYGVLIGGVFGGLAGTALALAELGLFVPNMTGGRGFIVLASHVVGKWDPIIVTLVCLLFGAADAFQLRAQLSPLSVNIPYQVFLIIPYLVTILALTGLVGRTHPPKALSKPYEVETET